MKQVLVVEDSKIQSTRMAKLLCGLGFEVTEAPNGRAALEVLGSISPELIVTDLLMPEMDGIQLIEELNRIGSTIPVVVVSADIQDTTKNRCNELGVAAFINKPPKPEEFILTLQKIVGEAA